MCPQLCCGRSPRGCPGVTHIEDGEEHQDGDLEHADLDGDAVPDLDAGEDTGVQSCPPPTESPAALCPTLGNQIMEQNLDLAPFLGWF